MIISNQYVVLHSRSPFRWRDSILYPFEYFRVFRAFRGSNDFSGIILLPKRLLKKWVSKILAMAIGEKRVVALIFD